MVGNTCRYMSAFEVLLASLVGDLLKVSDDDDDGDGHNGGNNGGDGDDDDDDDGDDEVDHLSLAS